MMASRLHDLRKVLQGDANPEVKEFRNHINGFDVAISGTAVVFENHIVSTIFSKQKPSRLSALWFTLASLTLEYPAEDWKAFLVCNREKERQIAGIKHKVIVPHVDVLQIIGDDPDTRKKNAVQILKFGVEFRRLALQSVLPIGVDVLWLLGLEPSKSYAEDNLEYAFKFKDAYRLTRGIKYLWQLRREEPIEGFDDTLADGLLVPDKLESHDAGYRARRYAKWFGNIWQTTTKQPDFSMPIGDKK
jgi:hypothetical protein